MCAKPFESEIPNSKRGFCLLNGNENAAEEEFGAKSGKKSSKIRRKNAKFELFAIELMKFINSIAKRFWRFLTKKLRLENGAKECIV